MISMLLDIAHCDMIDGAKDDGPHGIPCKVGFIEAPANSNAWTKWYWHGDVIKWEHVPQYWPLVHGIHRSLVNSHHKGPWGGALMLSLNCAWINGWVNNREAGNLIRHHAHDDVTVMVHTCVGRGIGRTVRKFSSAFENRTRQSGINRNYNTTFLISASKC